MCIRDRSETLLHLFFWAPAPLFFEGNLRQWPSQVPFKSLSAGSEKLQHLFLWASQGNGQRAPFNAGWRRALGYGKDLVGLLCVFWPSLRHSFCFQLTCDSWHMLSGSLKDACSYRSKILSLHVIDVQMTSSFA